MRRQRDNPPGNRLYVYLSAEIVDTGGGKKSMGRKNKQSKTDEQNMPKPSPLPFFSSLQRHHALLKKKSRAAKPGIP